MTVSGRVLLQLGDHLVLGGSVDPTLHALLVVGGSSEAPEPGDHVVESAALGGCHRSECRRAITAGSSPNG